MRLFLALILAVLPAVAWAQAEDDAHRVDRTRTEDLNRGAAHAVDRRNAANAAKLDRYREAREDYQRAREEWRRRLAACEAGDDRACDPG
jgi:hypothetical protein